MYVGIYIKIVYWVYMAQYIAIQESAAIDEYTSILSIYLSTYLFICFRSI